MDVPGGLVRTMLEGVQADFLLQKCPVLALLALKLRSTNRDDYNDEAEPQQLFGP